MEIEVRNQAVVCGGWNVRSRLHGGSRRYVGRVNSMELNAGSWVIGASCIYSGVFRSAVNWAFRLFDGLRIWSACDCAKLDVE